MRSAWRRSTPSPGSSSTCPRTTSTRHAQLERFARNWREYGYSHWAVEEASSGRLIGRAGLLRHDDWPLAEYAVEVGWSLDPGYWGRGYATEAGRAGVECWLERLKEPQLISITTPANLRSRAVMKRLGFTIRGDTHWHRYDVVWYARDRPPAAV